MSQLVTLNIRGMTCASCVARLEKSLSKVAGVDAASVNLATEKAQIRVNQEPQIITSLLITAVEKAGFEASVFSHQASNSKSTEDLITAGGVGGGGGISLTSGIITSGSASLIPKTSFSFSKSFSNK